MPSENPIEIAAREFARLKTIADQALGQVPAEQFFVTLGEGENSIALVVKHVSGNMASRWTDFLTSDGEKPWRDRDREFEIDENDSRESLDAAWEKGWGVLLATVAGLGVADVDRAVVIRGESLTVLQAIQRQLSHYAYHVGQLVFLARHLVGADWVSLSVARGKSKQFNQNPTKYL